jgi:hypothetical protein
MDLAEDFFLHPLWSWPTSVPKPETLDQTDGASKRKGSPAGLDVTRRRLQRFQRSAPPYVSLNAPILLVRSDKAHDARRSRGPEFSADTDRSGSWLTMTNAPGAIFAIDFARRSEERLNPRKGGTSFDTLCGCKLARAMRKIKWACNQIKS